MFCPERRIELKLTISCFTVQTHPLPDRYQVQTFKQLAVALRVWTQSQRFPFPTQISFSWASSDIWSYRWLAAAPRCASGLPEVCRWRLKDRSGSGTSGSTWRAEQNRFNQQERRSCFLYVCSEGSSQLRDLRLRAAQRDHVRVNVDGLEVRQEVFQLKRENSVWLKLKRKIQVLYCTINTLEQNF